MSAPATVMFVDDDPRTLILLKGVLAREGRFRIETAQDGIEALERARATRPDLIFSDYSMPRLNGFELCRRLRNDPMLRDTVFVIISGVLDTQLKAEGLEIGVDDFLVKPVGSPELRAKVRATLRLRALHEALRTDHDRVETLLAQVRGSFDQLLGLLVNTMDLTIPGAAARGDRLARAAVRLAQLLDVPDEFLRDLELAARLHEVGRIVEQSSHSDRPANDPVPDWRYVLSSRAILEQVDGLTGAAEIVGDLFENWDGTGFPERKQKGEIAMRTRILRVLLDFFIALDEATTPDVTPTPYTALAMISRHGGTRYDPRIVSKLDLVLPDLPSIAAGDLNRRVRVAQLQAGMILDEDLITASGTKLLAAGAQLTDDHVEMIEVRNANDPIVYGAVVRR